MNRSLMSWRFKATTQSLFGFPSNHFMQNLSGNGENLGRGGGEYCKQVSVLDRGGNINESENGSSQNKTVIFRLIYENNIKPIFV